MDKALYVAMTGAMQTLRAQASVNHNLANASTTGFRAELAASEAAVIPGQGLPTRVNAVLEDQGFDPSQGAIQNTGRTLDVAVRAPNAWIAVQGADGNEAYTRAGDLTVDANGQLRNGAGHPVLGDGGPISIPPSGQITVGEDGTVSIVPQGQSPSTQATVGRIRVVTVDPKNLTRGNDGLMRARPGVDVTPVAGNSLATGALESSNVNLADTLVNMIQLARQFELQVKLMHTTDDNAQSSASLLRMG